MGAGATLVVKRRPPRFNIDVVRRALTRRPAVLARQYRLNCERTMPSYNTSSIPSKVHGERRRLHRIARASQMLSPVRSPQLGKAMALSTNARSGQRLVLNRAPAQLRRTLELGSDGRQL
jgi:hypothetical protein